MSSELVEMEEDPQTKTNVNINEETKDVDIPDLESVQSFNEKVPFSLLNQDIKVTIDKAEQLSKKVTLNSALLEKLKSELIEHKMRYAENQMLLADVQ